MAIFLVIPECFNVILLSASMYGMYRGIEIKHPLYAVLFSNLIVALLSSLINVIIFSTLPLNVFIRSTNAMSGISLTYHCNAWLSSSVLRYIYILHEDKFYRLIPNMTIQSTIFIVYAWISVVLSACPGFVTAIYFGKLFFFPRALNYEVNKSAYESFQQQWL